MITIKNLLTEEKYRKMTDDELCEIINSHEFDHDNYQAIKGNCAIKKARNIKTVIELDSIYAKNLNR